MTVNTSYYIRVVISKMAFLFFFFFFAFFQSSGVVRNFTFSAASKRRFSGTRCQFKKRGGNYSKHSSLLLAGLLLDLQSAPERNDVRQI